MTLLLLKVTVRSSSMTILRAKARFRPLFEVGHLLTGPPYRGEQWRAAMELLEAADEKDRAEVRRIQGLSQAELDEELKSKGVDPQKAGGIGLEALAKFERQQAAAKTAPKTAAADTGKSKVLDFEERRIAAARRQIAAATKAEAGTRVQGH